MGLLAVTPGKLRGTESAQEEGAGLQRAPAEWYEVVSQQLGPEVTDATMRRKIEESGQPWKVRDRAMGIEMVQ